MCACTAPGPCKHSRPSGNVSHYSGAWAHVHAVRCVSTAWHEVRDYEARASLMRPAPSGSDVSHEDRDQHGVAPCPWQCGSMHHMHCDMPCTSPLSMLSVGMHMYGWKAGACMYLQSWNSGMAHACHCVTAANSCRSHRLNTTKANSYVDVPQPQLSIEPS